MTPAPTPAQQDDLEQLEGFLQTLGGGSLVFCLYSSLDDVDYVQNALKDKLEKPIERRVLNAEHPNPLRQLRELPSEPARIVFMVYQGDLEEDLKLTAGYANVQREVLTEVNHVLVLWFGEESFARFVKAAPDFWAWHSGGVFEFEGIVGRKSLGEMLEATEATLPERKLVDLEGLKRRAESYKAILESYPNPTHKDLPYVARTYIRYASVLKDLHKFEEALDNIYDALDIVEEEPDFDDLFAEAQLIRALAYSGLGRKTEALEASQQAVQAYRQLSTRNPNKYLPNLAGSLNNLAFTLSELGRKNESLSYIREAAEIWERLAEQSPATHVPEFAATLVNLGTAMGNLGQKDEALVQTQRAVTIYKELTKNEYDRNLPDLALGLSNLGNRLSDVGRYEEGLLANLEAVEIRRRLAKANPEAFIPNLAASLNNLALRFNELGNLDKALEAQSEAVQLYKGLFDRMPNAYFLALAGSLNNVGVLKSRLGRPQDALSALVESIKYLFPFWKKYPEALTYQLQMFVSNYLDISPASGRTSNEDMETLNSIFGDNWPDFVALEVLESQPKPQD